MKRSIFAGTVSEINLNIPALIFFFG